MHLCPRIHPSRCCVCRARGKQRNYHRPRNLWYSLPPTLVLESPRFARFPLCVLQLTTWFSDSAALLYSSFETLPMGDWRQHDMNLISLVTLLTVPNVSYYYRIRGEHVSQKKTLDCVFFCKILGWEWYLQRYRLGLKPLFLTVHYCIVNFVNTFL